MKCNCGHDECVHDTRSGGCIVAACDCGEFKKADDDPGFDNNDWGDE